jgi:hypothetical protein
MTQHASLTPERWARFSLEQQILMIGNEMHRTTKALERGDANAAGLGYERILRLTDLTIETQPRRGFRREMLRWRDLAAELFLGPDLAEHRRVFRALLLLSSGASRQIPFVLG